jgi:hypothetical protein
MKRCNNCGLLRSEVDIKPIYVSRERTIDICIGCSRNIFGKFINLNGDLK